jgi:membrane protein
MVRQIVGNGWSILRSTSYGWRQHNGSLLSAATAYYAAFSFFPLCLVLIAGVGFVGRYSSFAQIEQRDLLHRAAANVGPWLAGELQGILAGVQSRAMLGGPIGIFVLLLTAIGIFRQLENIFDRIWGVPQSTATGFLTTLRTVVWGRLLAFLSLLIIGTLLMTVFLTDIVVAGIRPFLAQLPAGRSVWHFVQLLSTIGCNALLLAAIYRVLPKAPVHWRAALAGGLFAAVVWALGRYALLSLLIGEQYSAYGVIGALMGVMLWFYYASAVVFLGAEFVHALEQESSSDDRP